MFKGSTMMKLGEMLVQKGLISEVNLQQVIKMQLLTSPANQKIGELLVSCGMINPSIALQSL